MRMTMTIFGIIIMALVPHRLCNFTSCVLLYGGARNVTAIEGKIINTSSFECLFAIYVIDLLSLTIALLLVKNSFKTVCHKIQEVTNMEKEQIFDMIKKDMGEVPKPLENLASLDMNVLIGHIQAKKNAYAGESLDKKTKALIALAVGIALDSQSCIMNNVKAAKNNGASTSEIMEAYSVAKFSKSASSISGFAMAMDWLLANQDNEEEL